MKDYRKLSISNRLLTVLLSSLIVIYTVILCIFASRICDIKKEIASIKTDIETQSIQNGENSVDSSVSTYIEISDKADAELDRLVSIFGILATAYTLFGALIVFKAPHSIDKRIASLDDCIAEVKHSAEEAKYQSDIIQATTNQYNGEQTSYDKIRQLTRIIEDNPDRTGAYLVRAFEYDNHGQFDKAINDYSIVLKLQKNNIAALNGMAIAYSNKGEHRKAIKLYSMAIDIKEDADYISNRGTSYHETEQIDLALKDYNRALELDNSCKGAYINRSSLYIDLMNKEDNITKKEQFRQSAIEDLRSALDIDREDRLARAKLAAILRPTEEVMLARIDERIGDLEIEDKNYISAWKQYAEAINIFLNKLFRDDADYTSDVDRVFEKLSNILCDDLFPKINESEDKFYDDFYRLLSNYATKKYISGDKGYAERLFLYCHNIQNHGKAASLNLAYMKRRKETLSTTYSVRSLLSESEDKQDIIWCVNTALCYIDGVEEYEKDWSKVISSLNYCEIIDSAVSWWGNTELVGEKESNIVMLILHLVPVCYDDPESVENRIKTALEQGYEIPDDIITTLKNMGNIDENGE